MKLLLRFYVKCKVLPFSVGGEGYYQNNPLLTSLKGKKNFYIFVF